MRFLSFLICICLLTSCQQKSSKKQKESDQNEIKTDSTVQIGEMTIRDLTNRYTIRMPQIWDSLNNIVSFNVAAIPLDSVGKTNVPWNELNPKETRMQFQLEMLNCVNAKDSSNETGSRTEKKSLYCLRRGYSDGGGMGHFINISYYSFVKENKLIVLELVSRWSACSVGYESEKEIKDCELSRKTEMEDTDKLMEKVISQLTIQ